MKKHIHYISTKLTQNLKVAVSAAFGFGLMLASAAPLEAGSLCQSAASNLKPGTIVYTDSGNGFVGGGLIILDPVTGERKTILSGLDLPLYLLIDPSGGIVLSASGRVIRINTDGSQVQTLLQNSSSLPRYACGLDLDRQGNIVCAALSGVVALDLNTLALREIPGCSNLSGAISVVVAKNGDLIVLMRNPAQVLSVDPHNGKIRVIATGGYLRTPQSIAIRGHDAYVTDVATTDGNFGIGTVVHIDDRDGSQTLAAYGENLMQPMGIAIDDQGQLIVADPYTVNPASPDIRSGGYDGAVIRINPMTQRQTVLARGEGSFVNPRGVAIVPAPTPAEPIK